MAAAPLISSTMAENIVTLWFFSYCWTKAGCYRMGKWCRLGLELLTYVFVFNVFFKLLKIGYPDCYPQTIDVIKVPCIFFRKT